MQIYEEKEIERCIDCPFFSHDMDGMYCGHPYFHGKETYACHIISHSNNTGIPEKCPLRQEEITTIQTVRLEQTDE